MLKNIFKYESKLLLRSRWIQLLSIVLLLLFGFSANNGKRKADNREEIINTAMNEVDENDYQFDYYRSVDSFYFPTIRSI